MQPRMSSASASASGSLPRRYFVANRIRTVLSTLPPLQFLFRQRLEEGVGSSPPANLLLDRIGNLPGPGLSVRASDDPMESASE